MFIEGTDGRVGEHLQFTSSTDTTFSLVKLPDGTFEEWNIKYCREVGQRKTSEQWESPATDRQHTQHAIAALRSALSTLPVNLGMVDQIVVAFELELQQHAGA